MLRSVRFTWNGKDTARGVNFYKSLEATINSPETQKKFQNLTRERWDKMVVRMQRDIARDAAMLPQVMRQAATEASGDAASGGGLTGRTLSAGHAAPFSMNPNQVNARVAWVKLSDSTLAKKKTHAGAGKFFHGRSGQLRDIMLTMRPYGAEASRVQYLYKPAGNILITVGQVKIATGRVIFSANSKINTTRWFNPPARGDFEKQMGLTRDQSGYRLLNTGSSGNRPFRPLIFPTVAFFAQVRYPALVKRVLKEAARK